MVTESKYCYAYQLNRKAYFRNEAAAVLAIFLDKVEVRVFKGSLQNVFMVAFSDFIQKE
jgi:hypothetical protein